MKKKRGKKKQKKGGGGWIGEAGKRRMRGVERKSFGEGGGKSGEREKVVR